MMRFSMAGMVIVSMTLGGCAAKQQPAPLTPRIVHEVAPSPAAPPPLTAAQILAAQPAEVREAVKEHEQKGEWPIYKTTAYVLYPYNEGPEPMVESIGKMLQQIGVPKKRIKQDWFPGYPAE